MLWNLAKKFPLHWIVKAKTNCKLLFPDQIENSDDDQLISEVYLDSTDESDGDESESYHHNSEPTTNIENVKLEQRSTKGYNIACYKYLLYFKNHQHYI